MASYSLRKVKITVKWNKIKERHRACYQVLCLNCFWQEHPVINVVVAGNLAAVVSVKFDDLREIVIDGIEFKVLFTAPFDCFQ